MFLTLVFHEIRPQREIDAGQRPIRVADGYEDRLPLPLYNSTENFSEQMSYLKDNGYNFLTLEQIKAFYENATPLPDKAILITFDDAYQSQKKYAYPILKALNIPAVLFEPSGWVFEEASPYAEAFSQVLSFDEITEMSDVFTTANHTHHFHQRHGIEESRCMWESPANVAADILRNNNFVTDTEVFAYPFGLYNVKSITILEELGFKLAFTTKPSFNSKSTNPLELCREVVPYTFTMTDFKKMLGEL